MSAGDYSSEINMIQVMPPEKSVAKGLDHVI